MNIHLAKSAGFCIGVKRAITIALETARSHKKVCMLGDIVHNEEVVSAIKRAGVKKIQRLGTGAGKVLIVRAHGAGIETFADAKRCGYTIIDATCPMVKEIHAVARDMEKHGYTVIVIGDKKHDEVRGIAGQLKHKAVIIDSGAPIPLGRLRGIKKAGVIVQSTQNIDKVAAIVEKLREIIPGLIFRNTICLPTRTKQKEIKSMPLENDCMIIIGSKESANTKRLYEISRSLNKRSYQVSSEKELKKKWFEGVRNAGITAGASTPEETIQAIVRAIAAITA